MKRLIKLITLFTLGLVTRVITAQSTIVQAGPIQDPAATIWAYANVSYVFVSAPGQTNTPIWNGAPLPAQYLKPQTVLVDSSGHFTVTVPSNTAVTPLGSSWNFVICPIVSFSCSTINTSVAGSNVDLTTTFNAAIPAITIYPTVIPSVYNTGELQALNPPSNNYPGQIAYNYNSDNVMFNSHINGWTTIGGGGGGGTVTSVSVISANGLQGTVANPTTTPAITLSPDSTHIIPTNTGSATTYLNGAGAYTIPAAGGILPNPSAGVSQTITQTSSSFTLASNTGNATATTGLYIPISSTGTGYYNNNGPWTTTAGINENFFDTKPGINHAINGNMSNLTVGDVAWMYAYMQMYGCGYFGSDECGQFITGQMYQAGYTAATITTPLIGTIPVGSNLITPNNITQIIATTSTGTVFKAGGTLNSLSLYWGTNPPTAQTGYFVLYTLNADGTATPTQIISVPVTAVGSTTQTWTASTFGTINVLAGQGIGTNIPLGNGPSSASGGSTCLLNSGGTPLTGLPTVGKAYALASGPNTDLTCFSNLSQGAGIEATLNPPTLGSTQLAFTNPSCNAHNDGCLGQAGYAWATKGMALDMQTVSYSGTVASQSTVLGDQLAYTLTGATLPVSTAWGTVTSCSNPGTTQVYSSNVCTVNIATTPASPGNFAVTTTPATDVCLAGPYTEEAAVTAVGTPSGGLQSVTINSQYNWTSGTIIMQGGVCGQGAVSTTNLAADWPMANFAIGATSATQVLLTNCAGGGCFATGNVPGFPFYSSVTATRTSNVVTAGPYPFILDVTPYPVGSSINVSGCTVDTDLNGTFTVSTNSMDNANPVMTWAQTGANEGPDTTCTISNLPTVLNFYPGAYVTQSDGQDSATVATNHVNWTNGDIVKESPATSLGMVGLQLYMGQQTPTNINNGGIRVVDSGPSPQGFLLNLINTGGYGGVLPTPAPTMALINGSFTKDFDIGYRPANNGTLLFVQGGEVYGGAAKPYSLFEDNAAAMNIGVDVKNFQFTMSKPLFIEGSEACTAANGVCPISAQVAANLANNTNTGVTGILPVANGGSGTTTPSIVAGTNVTVSGTWPNQTINSSGGGNPSVGAAGAVQAAGSTTGTFADSGCTATSGAMACSGGFSSSASALAVINGVTGGIGFAAGSVALTPTASEAGLRYDSVTGLFKATLGTGAEYIPLLNYSVSTLPQLNQPTTSTAANLSGTPALPNGTSATTQAVGDNSTKLATDAFVLANTGGGATQSMAVPRDANWGMATPNSYSNGFNNIGPIYGHTAGTPTFSSTPDSNGLQFATFTTGTTINTQQGFDPSDNFLLGQKNFDFKVSFGLGTTTGVNAWVGGSVSNGAPLAAVIDPALTGGSYGQTVAFRYFSGTDAHWKCYVGGTPGTAGQVVDSGVAPDTTNLQTFDLFTTFGGAYVFYINGTQVCNFTPTNPMPSGGYSLGMFAAWENTTTTSVTAKVGRVYGGEN